MKLTGNAKFKRKRTCGLKNNMMSLVNFHASSWMYRNLHFDIFLLSKAYEDLDKKGQKSYVSCHWGIMQCLKKNWLLVPSMAWGIWWILMRAVASLENLHFAVLFLSITYKVSAKRLKKNYLSWHWRRSKLWRKTDFLFEKWHEEFGELKPEQWKVWKFSFYRKYLFELKKYRGIVSWKMTHGFKNDISNFVNFHASSWK